MSGPFGITAGPWIDQCERDRGFSGMYDTWLAGGEDGDSIVCACWNNDAHAIAQVPAMLELVKALAEVPQDSVLGQSGYASEARAIARRLEEK